MAQNQLIAPFRFAIVEDQLYRGGYPTKRNFRFLKRLHLKTMLALTPKPPGIEQTEFCKENKINLIHFPISKVKDDVTLTPQIVSNIITLLITLENLPIYIFCLDGRKATGLVIMCLRKLQNWNLSSTCTEFSRFAKGSVLAESEFVEAFRGEVVIPEKFANWLWNGSPFDCSGEIIKHSSLKLLFWISIDQQIQFPQKQKPSAVFEFARGQVYDQNQVQQMKSRSAVKALALEGLDKDIRDKFNNSIRSKVGINSNKNVISQSTHSIVNSNNNIHNNHNFDHNHNNLSHEI
eukprot:TRINITY_DN375_c2_g2_i1.p1 TRINITY_DN375_c2_g2~~TRINITY_DN375_c2_g2_i1.p1  ORF type:complete len:300 (-),score=109.88 TRINITY_DN375_c2_g2_i1:421-1296(-)